ncbi:head-tail connector protein [uncultured Thioclava sp.]|uniref:head-tail connector protein n=1 Tax=uncultured Thioclava sp. TaxID=473858 RepID=UPI0025EA2CBF|nr:head-tail connector protein [uncultured Thioclava sp.]
MALTVTDLKAHLKVDFDDDDAELARMLTAASLHAERYLRRDLATDYPDGIPEPVEVAILQHAASMYRYREAGTTGAVSEVPMGWKDLLSTYRVFM